MKKMIVVFLAPLFLAAAGCHGSLHFRSPVIYHRDPVVYVPVRPAVRYYYPPPGWVNGQPLPPLPPGGAYILPPP